MGMPLFIMIVIISIVIIDLVIINSSYCYYYCYCLFPCRRVVPGLAPRRRHRR